MKLPRLPHKCSVLEAKYSAEQMKQYAQKCIDEYMKQITLIEVAPSEKEKSIIDKIKESWT